MKFFNKKKLGVYFGLLFSFFCLLWLAKSIDFGLLVENIKQADMGLLALAVCITACSYLLRAWRWQFFFDKSSPAFSDLYRCLIVGFFMNNVLPARMGELVRAHFGAKAAKTSRSVVLATVAGERLFDGLVLSAIFAIVFTLGATDKEVEGASALYYVAFMFLLATISTAVLLYLRRFLFLILEKIAELIASRKVRYIFVRIKRFVNALGPMFRPKRLVIIMASSIAIWLIELSVYICIIKAFGASLSIGGASLFLAAVNFSSLLPAAPGGVGVIEAIATAFLVKIGIQAELALGMVAMQHVIQISVVGLPGAYYFYATMGGHVPEEIEKQLADDTSESEESDNESKNQTEGSVANLITE